MAQPALNQSDQQVSGLPQSVQQRMWPSSPQLPRDNEAFVQFREPAGVPSCTVSPLIFI